MKTIVIIQARMGSSRLAGKILMPLGESCVLDYVVSRCRQIAGIYDVVVATSSLPQDDMVQSWCEDHGISCYRGSEEDVLLRYVEAAAPYNPDYVIRVTGDCPFVDYEFASRVVQAMAANPAEFVIYPEHEELLPRGINVEMMSHAALLRMHRDGHEPRHREHVTYYAKEYPGQFEMLYFEVPEELRHPQLRITLDVPEDYDLCRRIADAFPGDKLVSTSKVIAFLLEHPDIAAINAHIQQKPVV